MTPILGRPMPDGQGFSLVLIDEPSSDLGEVANWKVSESIGGHPGSGGGGVEPPQMVMVSISAEGPGTATKNPDTEQHVAGSRVTVTAVANPGARFLRWSGDAGFHRESLCIHGGQ